MGAWTAAGIRRPGTRLGAEAVWSRQGRRGWRLPPMKCPLADVPESRRARRKRDARLGGATSRCGRTIMANNAVVRRLENSGPRLDDRLKAFFRLADELPLRRNLNASGVRRGLARVVPIIPPLFVTAIGIRGFVVNVECALTAASPRQAPSAPPGEWHLLSAHPWGTKSAYSDLCGTIRRSLAYDCP